MSLFLKNIFNLFIYWLLQILVEACGIFHCGAQASHCGGFSCYGARALDVQASVVVARGLSTCGPQA